MGKHDRKFNRKVAKGSRMRYEEMISEAEEERKREAKALKKRRAEAKALERAISKKAKQVKREEARLRRLARKDKK